ncbi:MAG TPA: hypothetical protein VFW46_14815 [Stellaceae bacterium]|nr:hypothetical protein [Stellaceae bacterium]
MAAQPAKPLVRTSGGNPAGMPDFRPLNPWGRAMPKPTRLPPPPRYQVFVEAFDPISATGRKLIPIGPKGDDQFVRPLCEAIEQAIASGQEKTWRNPHVVRLI